MATKKVTKKVTKKSPAKKTPAKKLATTPTPTRTQVCGTGCVFVRFLKGLLTFIIDLIWFVVDILHAVGFVLAALIAAVALLIVAFGLFLNFIGVQDSAEFQKLRENMIHIESISRTSEMMEQEYEIMQEIRATEQKLNATSTATQAE